MAKNIFLQDTASPLPYASQGGGGGPKYPVLDDPNAHAKFISRKKARTKTLHSGRLRLFAIEKAYIWSFLVLLSAI